MTELTFDLESPAPAGETKAAPTLMDLAPRANSEVFFDLETAPDYKRMELFGLDPLPPSPAKTPIEQCPDASTVIAGGVSDVESMLARVNGPPEWLTTVEAAELVGKKRKGVLDAIAEARKVDQRYNEIVADRRKLLSTTPEFCRIVAIGVAVGNSGDVASCVVGQGGVTEEYMLDAWWRIVRAAKPVTGFNIVAFDLPIIFARTAILGVNPTRRFDLRPWGGEVNDIYLARFNGRSNPDPRKPGKLKLLAPIYGISVPAGDVDGSQVEELLASDPAKLGEYVRSDVEITRKLRNKWSGLFC